MTQCDICGNERKTKKVKYDSGEEAEVCQPCIDACCERCEVLE